MRLLFIINSLEIGGTRRSLLNLLTYMSNYKVDLSLLVFSPYGEYEKLIPPKVNVIKGNMLMQGHFLKMQTIKDRKKYSLLFYRMIGAAGKKLLGEDRFWDGVLRQFARKMVNEDYDAVIGFQEGFCDFFTTFVDIKPRLIWIHNDYSNIPQYRIRGEEAYKDIDRIFFVADTAKESFSKAFPSLKDKMRVIKNIVPQEEIKKKSEEVVTEDFYLRGKLNIVSVGRIEKQKAFDRIIGVFDRLGNLKDNINWIIIGEGTLKEELERNVMEKGYQNYIHFIGSRSNPYPYVANSDLFVLTSQYESQPMVIMEALTVGTPVVSTNFTSSYELLEAKDYGVVCDNNEEGIYKAILDIINCPEKLDGLKLHTSEFVYDNDAIVNQIFRTVKEYQS